MKVKLEIELDLPDVFETYGDPIEQIVCDNYIKFVTIQHFRECSAWNVRSNDKTQSQEYRDRALQISNLHNNWGISSVANISVTVNKGAHK